MTKFNIRSRIKSFKYAFEGIFSMLRYEHNSRIHSAAAILVIVSGLLLHINLYEWIVICIVTGLVFITELINSAIELLADLIDPGINPGIKRAKDYAAAAVLISAIIAVIAAVLIFGPKIIALIR
jgi:diacylglycerol kinase (ATP)